MIMNCREILTEGVVHPRATPSVRLCMAHPLCHTLSVAMDLVHVFHQTRELYLSYTTLVMMMMTF